MVVSIILVVIVVVLLLVIPKRQRLLLDSYVVLAKTKRVCVTDALSYSPFLISLL